MRVYRWVFLFLVLLSSSLYAWDSSIASKFTQANRLYRSGDFKEAARIYDELAQEYPQFAALHFNLGNALYRSGSVGGAVLAYERALLREPRSGDIHYNLNFVNGQMEFRIQDKRNWYIKALETTLDRVTREEVSILGLGFYFVFTVSWITALFFNPGLPWGGVRKSLLVLAAFFILLAAFKYAEPYFMADAVVTAKEAVARYGPSDTDQVAFRLGEGLKAHVVDHREGWSRVSLVNGESGWIKNSDITEVRS